MKNIFLTLAAVTGMLFSVSSMALNDEYEEGVHYTVIEGQQTSKRELREYFSLLCPHCFSMEKFIPMIEDALPEGMPINRTHVNFIGGYDTELQNELTKGLVAAGKRGKDHEYIEHVFKKIHEERKRPQSKQFIVDALVGSGVSENEDDARKILGSTFVNMQQRAMLADQSEMIEKGVLLGVPSFSLNNRYMIDLSSLDKEDPIKDLGELVRFLENKGS